MEKIKKIKLPIKVLLISVIVGILVAGIGGIKEIKAHKTNEERREAARKASEEAVKEANKRLDEIVKEYNELKPQYEAKLSECNSLKLGSNDWYANKTKCDREANEIYSRLSELESEDSLIKAKDYTGYYQLVKPMSYQIFYIIGGGVALLGAIAAFIIYLVKGKKTY